jgi:transposase
LKAQIVAESFVRGAVVVEIGRRHGCRPQQVHAWRKLARAGKLVLPASEAGLTFVPLLAETGAPTRTPPPVASEIVVEIGDCVVRVHGRPGAAALADVFVALREARSC